MAKYGTFKYGHAKYGAGVALWICSRRQSDLDNNTELAYINYWDLNRIETRIQELSDLAGLNLSVKTDWHKVTSEEDKDNVPTAEQMNRIINNINILRSVYPLLKTAPDTPASMEKIDIYEVNNIEQILYLLYVSAKE